MGWQISIESLRILINQQDHVRTGITTPQTFALLMWPNDMELLLHVATCFAGSSEVESVPLQPNGLWPRDSLSNIWQHTMTESWQLLLFKVFASPSLNYLQCWYSNNAYSRTEVVKCESCMKRRYFRNIHSIIFQLDLEIRNLICRYRQVTQLHTEIMFLESTTLFNWM